MYILSRIFFEALSQNVFYIILNINFSKAQNSFELCIPMTDSVQVLHINKNSDNSILSSSSSHYYLPVLKYLIAIINIE